ncbi:MAG TPA: hypothetical protein VHM89_06030 [Acidimicrobiales bacterium]|nr:hypothetical protein [Acidimicrobiales bacterium]
MSDTAEAQLHRRVLLRRAAVGSVAAGIAWAAPSVTAMSVAGAVGSLPPGGGPDPPPPPGIDDPDPGDGHVDPDPGQRDEAAPGSGSGSGDDDGDDGGDAEDGGDAALRADVSGGGADGRAQVLGTELSAETGSPAAAGSGLGRAGEGETLPRTGLDLGGRRAAAGALLGGAAALAMIRRAAASADAGDVWVARAPAALWRRLPRGRTAVLAQSGPPLVLDDAGSRLWERLEEPVRLRDLLDPGDPAGDAPAEDVSAVVEALHARGLLVLGPP